MLCPLCGALHLLCPLCQRWWEGLPPCICGWHGSTGSRLRVTTTAGSRAFSRGEAVPLWGHALLRLGLVRSEWELAPDVGLVVYDHAEEQWAVCLNPRLPPGGRWLICDGTPVAGAGPHPLTLPARLDALGLGLDVNWE